MFLDQFIYIAEGWASQFLILKKSGRMSVNSKTITWHSISMCDKYKWHIFYNISFYPVLIKYLFFRDIVLVWDQSNILIVKIKWDTAIKVTNIDEDPLLPEMFTPSVSTIICLMLSHISHTQRKLLQEKKEKSNY